MTFLIVLPTPSLQTEIGHELHVVHQKYNVPNCIFISILVLKYATKLINLLSRPGAHQSSKAAFCKSAFAKSKLTFSKRDFARSRFAFRQSIFASQKAMVWPSAASKLLCAKTCQNVLESIFAFC